MDNNNPTIQPTNPIPQHENNFFTKKKIVILTISLFFVMLLGIIGYFFATSQVSKQPEIVLKINDTQIPTEDYQSVLNYYESNQELTDNPREQTIDLFKENIALKKEFYSLGNTDADLVSLMTNYTEDAAPNDSPLALKTLLRENTVLKEFLQTQIEIKQASGEMILIQSLQSQETDPSVSQQIFSLLTTVKNNIESGSTIEDEVESLSTNRLVTEELMDVIQSSFVNSTPARPAITGDEFKTTVFNTPVGQLTEIFTTENNLGTLYGIALVTESNQGNYDSYEQFIEEKKSLLNVQINE